MQKYASADEKKREQMLSGRTTTQCSLFPQASSWIKSNQDSPAAGAKLEAGGAAPKFEGGAEPAAAESGF